MYKYVIPIIRISILITTLQISCMFFTCLSMQIMFLLIKEILAFTYYNMHIALL